MFQVYRVGVPVGKERSIFTSAPHLRPFPFFTIPSGASLGWWQLEKRPLLCGQTGFGLSRSNAAFTFKTLSRSDKDSSDKSMENIFKRARLSYRIQSTFFKVAESLIAIVTGGFIGVAIQEKAFSWGILICSLLFLATQILKFVLATSVGSEILQELWCRHELETQKRILNQSLSNFRRITRSIRCLNQTTCSISNPVCIGPFADYIRPLLKTFFDNFGEILCTRDSKIYLALHCTTWERNADGYPVPIDFSNIIQNDFPDLTNDRDFLREYKSVCSRAEELNILTIYQTQYTKQVNCVIGCPIPTVCLDGSTLGCVMIAANIEPAGGCNLQEIMEIYAHILSNSISKYIDCVHTPSIPSVG